jgi:hypothetical protein
MTHGSNDLQSIHGRLLTAGRRETLVAGFMIEAAELIRLQRREDLTDPGNARAIQAIAAPPFAHRRCARLKGSTATDGSSSSSLR